MSVLIRDIKRLGEGDKARSSLRDRRLDKLSISVGRMTDCDIQISELSVQQSHANIEVLGHDIGRLILEAGATAHLDGRFISSGHANLRAGSVIRIGETEIRVLPSEAQEKELGPDVVGHLSLAVEAVGAQMTSAVIRDADTLFQPSVVLPSRRILSWMGGLAIVGFFLIWPISHHKSPDRVPHAFATMTSDAAWNSGSLSNLHANLEQDCAACHTNAFEPVSDTSCLSCHTGVADHAEPAELHTAKKDRSGFDAQLARVSDMFGRTDGRCASCHVEHNGTAHIIESSDKRCTDCHSDMNLRLTDTDIGNVSRFDTDHPQFRPLIITNPDPVRPTLTRLSLDQSPQGFSGLKFPHDIHMDDTSAVARMANTLSARFAFSDGVSCEDCHRPEVGGALFEPVRMEQDCAMCHSLTFEIEADGYERTLRHGEPEEVIAAMRDFYDAKALANIRDIATDSRTRRRPGSNNRIRALNQRELAFQRSAALTAEKVNDIFSDGGACYDCHEIERPVDPETLDFSVQPISVSERFYASSTFNHQAHEIEGLSCASCHAAETSSRSDDILLPKIDVCRDCHISEDRWKARADHQVGAFPTNCLTCHSYHENGHMELMFQTATTASAR